MKYRKLTILSGILMFFLFSQVILAQGEKRDVTGFKAIKCSIPADMEISQGNTEELILFGDSEDLEKIITKVSEGNLKIYTNSRSNLDNIKIKITVKELNAVSLSGSGSINFNTPLKTDEMELRLSGSGKISCPELTASELEIGLSGSGNVNVGGKLEGELEVSISGSANVDCSNLQAKEVKVKISGSGDVKVWATEELVSNISGSGSVYYKGKPLVEANTSGSGKTKPLK